MSALRAAGVGDHAETSRPPWSVQSRQPELQSRNQLGYLREAYRTPMGTIDYRCSGEPVTIYVSKGGKVENTAGRKCLCNALMANIGHPQTRNGKYVESGMVTSGNDLTGIARFLQAGASTYTAADVVADLITGIGFRASSRQVSQPAVAATFSSCD
jgi:hypothetical protein